MAEGSAAFHARRRRSERWRLAISSGSAVLLHGILVLGAVLGPALFEGQPQVIEYVAVPVVSAAALGIRDPAPPAPRAETRPEPEPAPTPEPPAEPQRPVLTEPADKRPTSTEPAPPRQSASPPPAGPTGRRGAPTGSPSGTSSADIAGFDDPDFVYGYYLDRMVAQIRAQWVRPVIGGEVSAVISFRIQEDGKVSGLRIERSSGYGAFDLAALRAVQSASPLPPLPKSYRKESLGVDLIVR